MVGKIKIVLVLVLILPLSACSGHSRKDDCGVGSSVKCKSVTEVNNMISSGELDAAKNAKTSPVEVSTKRLNFVMNNADFTWKGRANKSDIIRAPEQTTKIWISGFEDEMGDYIEETYVYTVVEGGKWINVK